MNEYLKKGFSTEKLQLKQTDENTNFFIVELDVII